MKPFKGKIDYVRVFDHALNEEETKEEMQNVWDELDNKIKCTHNKTKSINHETVVCCYCGKDVTN